MDSAKLQKQANNDGDHGFAETTAPKRDGHWKGGCGSDAAKKNQEIAEAINIKQR